MGRYQQGPAILAQHGFQGGEGGQVEVVARLVEQQLRRYRAIQSRWSNLRRLKNKLEPAPEMSNDTSQMSSSYQYLSGNAKRPYVPAPQSEIPNHFLIG